MMEGRNGEKILVADAMDFKPWIIPPDTKVEEALTQLMQRQVESCVIAEKNGQVRGSLDLKDLATAQADGRKRKTVADLLPQTTFFVGAQSDLIATLSEMQKRGLRVAAVLEGTKLVGELRLGSIGLKLPALFEQKQKELDEIRTDRDRKDEYLGLVSHDMRAPLTVIALSTDYLLATESVKTLNQDQKSFVERIKRNGEQAASMIHDILDVVRLERGFLLDYQLVTFSQLLSQCLQNLDLMAAKKKVTFQISHEHELQINLDPSRMRQVIENVLINAIKFSPEGGQVFIRTWLAQKSGGMQLAFQVRDQGQGIRKEDEAKVFEAFVQTGRAKGGQEGVGLGLAIVRKFVEFHQGTLELDGGWKKGASLTIFLPHAALLSAAQPAQAVVQGPVVLLVEDDESIREFYKESLLESKYHVLEAGDGAEAFTLFQKHHVDLVLSDIRMPNVDGLELLARIRTVNPTIPVILCSGYYVGLENDLTRSDHKPNRIIDKPFKVRDMVEAIEDQLRHYKQAS